MWGTDPIASIADFNVSGSAPLVRSTIDSTGGGLAESWLANRTDPRAKHEPWLKWLVNLVWKRDSLKSPVLGFWNQKNVRLCTKFDWNASYPGVSIVNRQVSCWSKNILLAMICLNQSSEQSFLEYNILHFGPLQTSTFTQSNVKHVTATLRDYNHSLSMQVSVSRLSRGL